MTRGKKGLLLGMSGSGSFTIRKDCAAYSEPSPRMTPTKPSARPRAVVETAPQNGFSLVSNEKLIALYTAMLRCRLAERHSRTAAQADASARSFRAASLGHEAAAAATAIDLRPSDRMLSAHWAQSALNSIRPAVPAIDDLDDALAFARRLRKKMTASLVLALSLEPVDRSGPWLNTLERASEERLPILFVAPAVQRRRNKAGTNRALFKSSSRARYTFPTMLVDGGDAVAMYRVATECAFHARKGHGATLIECVHTPGADPIRAMEEYLRGKSLLTPGLKRQLTAAARAEMGMNA